MKKLFISGACFGLALAFLTGTAAFSQSVQTSQSGSGDLSALVEDVGQSVIPGDHVVIMSNGGFGGFHQQLLESLRQ